jgi:hypothetical protein
MGRIRGEWRKSIDYTDTIHRGNYFGDGCPNRLYWNNTDRKKDKRSQQCIYFDIDKTGLDLSEGCEIICAFEEDCPYYLHQKLGKDLEIQHGKLWWHKILPHLLDPSTKTQVRCQIYHGDALCLVGKIFLAFFEPNPVGTSDFLLIPLSHESIPFEFSDVPTKEYFQHTRIPPLFLVDPSLPIPRTSFLSSVIEGIIQTTEMELLNHNNTTTKFIRRFFTTHFVDEMGKESLSRTICGGISFEEVISKFHSVNFPKLLFDFVRERSS